MYQICTYVYASIYLSIYLSMATYLSIYLSIYLPIYLYTVHRGVYYGLFGAPGTTVSLVSGSCPDFCVGDYAAHTPLCPAASKQNKEMKCLEKEIHTYRQKAGERERESERQCACVQHRYARVCVCVCVIFISRGECHWQHTYTHSRHSQGN